MSGPYALPDAVAEPKPIEKWNAARQWIEHKHTVINHRLNWSATVQGFVFVMYGVALKAYTDAPRPNPYLTGCVALGLIGAAAPWFFLPDIWRHVEGIRRAEAYWKEQGYLGLPPLAHDPEAADERHPYRPNLWYMPAFVSACWLVSIPILVFVWL